MKKDPLSVNEVTYQFYNWLLYWKQTSPVMKDVRKNHKQFIILNWLQVWLKFPIHTHKETKNNSLLLIWESIRYIPSRTVLLNTTNSCQESVRINEVHFLQYIYLKKSIRCLHQCLSVMSGVRLYCSYYELLCRENLLKRLFSSQSISIPACHIFPALLSVPVLLCLQEILSRPFNKSKLITYRWLAHLSVS